MNIFAPWKLVVIADDSNFSSTSHMLITQLQMALCALILRSSLTSYQSICATVGKWYVKINLFLELLI